MQLLLTLSQIVKKMKDQLVNVISHDFSPGYVSENLGSSHVLSEQFVFGVIFEAEGSAPENHKFRCLLVQHKLLLQLNDDASVNDPRFQYAATAGPT